MPPYLVVKDEEKNSGQSDNDNSSDVDNWDLPLCYDKPRHIEPIKGADRVEHSWRVKEKVSYCLYIVNFDRDNCVCEAKTNAHGDGRITTRVWIVTFSLIKWIKILTA